MIPKKVFPEAWSCEASRRLNQLLKTKLREFCYELHTMIEKEASTEDLDKKIEEQMIIVHRYGYF